MDEKLLNQLTTPPENDYTNEEWYKNADAIFKARMADFRSYGQPGGYQSYLVEARKYQSNFDPMKTLGYLYDQRVIDSNWEYAQELGKSLYNGGIGVVRDTLNGIRAARDYNIALLNEQAKAQGFERNPDQRFIEALDNTAKAEALQPYEVKQSASKVGRFGLDVAQGAGQLVGQMAGSVAMNAVLPGVGGMALMVGQIAGGQYEDLKAKGVDTKRAATAAFWNAMIQAPFEYMSLTRLMKRVPAGSVLKKKLKMVLEDMLTEGTTEAIQQFPEEWAELWALNPDKSWKELQAMAAKKFPDTLQNALYAGLIGGVLGAGSRGIHIALDRNIDLALRKELHDERSAAMESRINHIKQSGISPDYAGETVNANLNNATVLIDGDTLNAYAQRVGEEKVAEKLGVTVEEIREAAEKGDTVEIKQGNFEALSASDPSFYQEVKDDLSFDANDMSNRKYNTIQANIERYSKIGEKERTELKTEVDKIAATMEEAGVPKGQIAGMKAMLTSFATAMRPDNPAQFIRDNALRFERGVTRREAFNQIAVNDAAYLEAVQQAEQTGDWTKVQQMVDEAAELANMANGQQLYITVQDGQYLDENGNPTGETIDFIEEMLDGRKLGETRNHRSITRKQWVGLAKNGKVYGMVLFGEPIKITNQSKEYKDAKIDGTNYGLKDGESKWYYPILDKQDLRDNPRDTVTNGAIHGHYQLKSNEPVTRDEDGNIIPLSQRFNPESTDFYRQEVSTRQPSAAGMPEELDPLFNLSFTDYDTAKSHEDSFKKNVEALRTIEGMDVPATDPYEAAEQMIDIMVDNLLFLYDQVPEELRDRAKLWYDGGHATAVEWGKRYGIPPQAAAAVIAVLSPQKDWFQNLSLAERILDCVYGHLNERWTDDMTTVAEGYTTQVEELNKKTGKMEMVDKDIKPLADGAANQAAYKRAKGKTLKELVEVGDYHAAAVWVRCYDKTHNENRYKVVTPEGGTGDYQKATRKVEVIDEDAPPPKPGKNYKTKFIEVVVDDPLKWQGYGPVSKAISIAVNPSVANIFYNVGDRHKVRNFYNNLDSPGSNKYATIDTHAVAAALLQPLGSSSKAVNQNFGANEGAAGTNETGIYGTYAFYFEAYRRAAEKMGILPREMQSIVWEVIRNMYPASMKQGADAKSLIADWKTTAEEVKKAVEEGRDPKPLIDEMRDKAYDLGTDEAGKLKPFAWENIPENAVIGDTYDRSNVTIQKFDKRERGVGGSSFGIEVAPDPNNKELTDLWNKLKKDNPLLAIQISDEVIGNAIKKVFHEFDMDFDQDKNLVSRLGGYLGDTNPSYEVIVENPNLMLAISKMLGRALSQYSVMLVSSQPALGTTPHDIVSVSLPDGWGDNEIDEFYKELYKIKAKDGGDLFTGHSSSDGVMTIVNTSDYPTQLLLDGIKSIAPNFSVDVTNGYCGFVSKDEYGFEDKDVPKPKPEEVVRIQIPEGWTDGQVNELAQKIGSMQNKRKKALSSGTSVADGVMTVEKGPDVSIKALLDTIKETLPELTAKKEKKDAGSNTEFIPEKIDDRRADLIKREASEELESKLRAATGQNVPADAAGSSQGNGPGTGETTDQGNSGVQNQATPGTGDRVEFKQENAPATQTKGSFDPFTDGEAVIKLFEGADASTVIHETGHYYIESMWREIEAGRATEQQKADFEKLMKYCGITTAQWAKMDLEGRRAAHERLAEAIETYVMEDKAPTRELRPVFKRFAKWLKAVYSAISRNRNAVPLTDEVREVFDRMLASEEDVEQMRRVEGYFEKLPSVITDNLSDATKKRIEDYILKAQDKAVEILTKERLANFSEERKREIENFRNMISDDVRQEVANRPLYVAARQAQELLGGEKPASAKQYANLYLEEKMSDENEVKWELVAEQNNMSPSELAQKLLEEPSENEAYEAAMKAAVQKEFPDYYTERAQAEEATRQAMYNDESGILLGVEQVLVTDFANRAYGRQVVEETKNKIKKEEREKAKEQEPKVEMPKRSAEETRKLAMAKRQQAKVAAQKELAKMKLKDATNVNKFMRAERNCAVKSAEAMAKKDYETARHYKDMQAFNHAMVIESANLAKRKQQYDKFLRRMARSTPKKWFSEQHWNQAMALFARMGIPNKDYDPTTRTESLKDYLDAMADWYYGFGEAPGWLLDETWPITDPKNLSFEDYETVIDLLEYIKTMDKAEKADNFFDSKMKYQEWRDQAIENLNKLATKFAPVLGEKQTATLKEKFDSAYQTLDNFLEKMDGWHFGFFSRSFGDAIKHANDREFELNEAYNKRISEAEKAWCPTKEALEKAAEKVYYEELGTSASKFVLTKMLMNLGNEGNARKLCGTLPSEDLRNSSLWVFENGMMTKDEAIEQTKENLLEFLGRVLTKEDIAYAQAKIDAQGMYWGERAELDRRTKGFTPKKVEAYPVTLTLANGETVVFRGGYFPLIRNGEMGSHPAGILPVSDTDPNQGRNVRTMYTDMGRSISRVEAAYPVDLSEGSEDRAMRAAIHDLCWRETMTEFRRILNDPMMFGMMKSKLGIADMTSFREMLEHAAQPNGSYSVAMGEDLFAKTAGWLRRKIVNSIVMFNFRINTQNWGNVFLYGNDIEGFTHTDTIAALANSLSNGFEGKSYMEMWKFVDEKSAYMRERNTTPDITLAEVREEGKLNEYERTIMEWGAKTMAFTDGMTARPVWCQAYYKKLNAGATEQEAIDFADTVIRRTLGSGRVTDVASLQRGTQTFKLFTAFQGFFNTQFNQWVREYNIDRRLWSEKEYKEMALRITSFVASKYLAACFFNLLLAFENPFGRDDDDEPMNYTKELLHYPMSLVGIFGQVANSLADNTLGIKSYGYRLSIIESGVDKLFRTGKNVRKMIDGDFAAGLESLTDVAGIAAGVPAQMNRLFWNAYDIFANDMDPRWSDLMTRRPKRERNK